MLTIHPKTKKSIVKVTQRRFFLPRALPFFNSRNQPSNMCYHRWFPITPEGCTASNPHVIMKKETIFCDQAIDKGLQQFEFDHNEQTIQKKIGALEYGRHAVFLTCVDETIKVMDSFNRIIEEEPIQAFDIYCPCCAGEMTMADALLVTTRDPNDHFEVINRKRIETDIMMLPDRSSLHIFICGASKWPRTSCLKRCRTIGRVSTRTPRANKHRAQSNKQVDHVPFHGGNVLQ